MTQDTEPKAIDSTAAKKACSIVNEFLRLERLQPTDYRFELLVHRISEALAAQEPSEPTEEEIISMARVWELKDGKYCAGLKSAFFWGFKAALSWKRGEK